MNGKNIQKLDIILSILFLWPLESRRRSRDKENYFEKSDEFILKTHNVSIMPLWCSRGSTCVNIEKEDLSLFLINSLSVMFCSTSDLNTNSSPQMYEERYRVVQSKRKILSSFLTLMSFQTSKTLFLLWNTKDFEECLYVQISCVKTFLKSQKK